jgi:actin-related protein
MCKVWEHIFDNELALDKKNLNVLVTDTPLSSKEKKQEIAQILLEKVGVKALSLMNSAVLSLFSTGRTRYVASLVTPVES